MPTQLGELEKPDLQLVRYEEELPRSRKELVAKFQTILERGRVQKVVVELGKPIQVSQLVDKSMMANPPVEDVADDVWSQLRNGEMDELQLPKIEPEPDGFEVLYYAFAELTKKKRKPIMVFCHDLGQVRAWLHLPAGPLESLYGIELTINSDVPEDAVILAGIAHDENPLTTTGLRVPVDIEAP